MGQPNSCTLNSDSSQESSRIIPSDAPSLALLLNNLQPHRYCRFETKRNSAVWLVIRLQSSSHILQDDSPVPHLTFHKPCDDGVDLIHPISFHYRLHSPLCDKLQNIDQVCRVILRGT